MAAVAVVVAALGAGLGGRGPRAAAAAAPVRVRGTDAEVPLPPRFCDRDENVTGIWDIDAEDLKWSHRTKEAVRRALAARARPLDLPRVYVYSFPEAFANASRLLAEAGATVESLFPDDVAAYGAPAEVHYWHLVYGIDGTKFNPRAGQNAWTRRADGGLDWVPAASMVGAARDPVGARHCSFVDARSQHVVGLVVHLGLRRAYARLVSDPADADLFFVPDHLTRDSKWADYDRLCAVLGRHWRRHLKAHRVPGASPRVSFWDRRHGRDHFFARNRAWHRYAKPRATMFDDAAARAGQNEKQGCCAWSHEGPGEDAAKLWIETQDPYQRAFARHAALPYPPIATAAAVATPGCSYAARGAGARPAAALLTWQNDAGRSWPGANARRTIAEQCGNWSGCDASPRAEFAHRKSRYVETYLDSVFCLNPPGASAGRRGIVDALVAGCVPVLFRATGPGVADAATWPYRQADLWPWHWAWQRASSVTLTDADLRARGGLRAALESVPRDQVALMRRVIREHARSLLWPGLPGAGNDPAGDGGPTAVDLAMHHLFALARAADRAAADPTTPYARHCTPEGLRAAT